MITDEAKLKYLKDGGNHCPYCGSKRIQCLPIKYDDELNSEVICYDCDKVWIDVYKLSGVEETIRSRRIQCR